MPAAARNTVPLRHQGCRRRFWNGTDGTNGTYGTERDRSISREERDTYEEARKAGEHGMKAITERGGLTDVAFLRMMGAPRWVIREYEGMCIEGQRLADLVAEPRLVMRH